MGLEFMQDKNAGDTGGIRENPGQKKALKGKEEKP